VSVRVTYENKSFRRGLPQGGLKEPHEFVYVEIVVPSADTIQAGAFSKLNKRKLKSWSKSDDAAASNSVSLTRTLNLYRILKIIKIF
jgi:hypothetical protein